MDCWKAPGKFCTSARLWPATLSHLPETCREKKNQRQSKLENIGEISLLHNMEPFKYVHTHEHMHIHTQIDMIEDKEEEKCVIYCLPVKQRECQRVTQRDWLLVSIAVKIVNKIIIKERVNKGEPWPEPGRWGDVTTCCLKAVFLLGVCDQLPVSDKKEDEEEKKKKTLLLLWRLAAAFAKCARKQQQQQQQEQTEKNISLALLWLQHLSPCQSICQFTSGRPFRPSVHPSIAPLSAAKLTSSFLFQADGCSPCC